MRHLPPSLWVNVVVGLVIITALLLTRDPVALFGLFFLQHVGRADDPPLADDTDGEPAIGFTADMD